MKNINLFLLLLLTLNIKAQPIRQYYDVAWKRTDVSNARSVGTKGLFSHHKEDPNEW